MVLTQALKLKVFTQDFAVFSPLQWTNLRTSGIYSAVARIHHDKKNLFNPMSDFGSHRLRVIIYFHLDQMRPTPNPKPQTPNPKPQTPNPFN
jgi:hypothetical protein